MLHKKISLPNPWSEGWSHLSFEKVRRIPLVTSIHINIELVELLKKYQIRIMLSELFYSVPNLISVIHSDTFSNDITKINWVYQAETSKMNWYEPLVSKDIKQGPGHSYIPYKEDEVRLIDSYSLESPELIQAAVPHNVLNGSGDRWALSLMLADSISFKQLGFADACQRLSDFL